MGIEIRQLRYAVLAADTQSFSRAAAALNVKQSTLSRKVTQLEVRLGVKLFERTTRGAQPTENGRAFIEQARRIVTDVDNLRTTAAAVSYGEQGRIAVGYSSSLLTGKLKLAFSDYLTQFPDVQFDGVEARSEKLRACLQSRSIDVAISPADLIENGIAVRPLWSERLLIALNTGHPLLKKERIHWSDLRREVFVVPSSGIGPVIANMLAARLTEQGYRPNIIVQDTSLESVISMVSAGRFIAITTEASQGITWPDLTFREIFSQGMPARLEFALFWCKDNENPALRRFFELIEERYAA
ncbi:LysR family transcriptional regulator [Sphingorhabdus sp. YGSMI21]|uniref:LysR family transcriptional regulator n=1 Tax=Sphingorhabdus sp. YGSMI21 TaxID=2077182 RepID=UPI000C1F8852|nr:LysR family transcriptional regulator [Sphingorhabdus sp. YGSMI21]ATW05261.1 LysR family transcriptional regulator [Sphingorhabdus sp. YGSMI21]